ncbi:LytTR family transcriptional regulator [alpha proteobacterium AAP81b]|nr:LytTR family transcriptional regulator [alpha proteobacterium AAP81b]
MTAPPLRAIAVDDEPLALERMAILCRGLPTLALVATASDAAAALPLIATTRPDLLFLDIAMPGLSGIDLARALPPPAPAIVFVTAFDHHAVAAFDVAAVDYLMKPIDAVALARAVARASERRGAPAGASEWLVDFWVPHRGEIIRVATADLDYVEAERDYMRLHTGGRSYLVHQTITDLERRLDPAQFLRIHRSVIVRRDRIARLVRDGGGAGGVALASGVVLPVGRTYAAAVRTLAGR